MITALAWRDAIVTVRTPGYWAAAAAHALLLGVFVVIWGDGIPGLAGSALDQIAGVEKGLLVALLPWAATRCCGTSREEVMVLAAVAASPASRIVAVRCVVAALGLAAIVGMGVPSIVLAQQISAAPARQIASTLAPALGMCALVAMLAVGSALIIPSRLGSWVLATAATATTVWLLPSWAPAFAWFIGLAGLGLAGLVFTADGAPRSLQGRHVR